MKIVAAGDRALLAELGEVSAAALHGAARSVRALPDVVACIPGHSSVYAIFEGRPDPVALAEALARAVSGQIAEPRHVRLPLHFDGPDLPELLERVTRERFLERMGDLRLTARYLGFRGGFAYLDGWPAEWAMPRRPTSRPFVPRGTFGVAGAVAGFYPIDSPGGWNLLGQTDVNLEHAIVPGDVITFDVITGERTRAVGEPEGRGQRAEGRAQRVKAPASPVRGGPDHMQLPWFDLLSGPLARVVGPVDWSGIERGVPPGGAFDELAASLANRAAGNRADAPLLECAMTGPRVRFTRDCVAAWCGPDLQLFVQRVNAGDERAFGRIEGGLRGYLAGGPGEGSVPRLTRGDRHRIRALAGPHPIEAGEIACGVTAHLDRVGIRLRPLVPLEIDAPADLRSIGMQRGTVQLHPDGSLVAMGPDHPVTGGYLQPMTVLSTETWKLAQLMPGERVVLVVE